MEVALDLDAQQLAAPPHALDRPADEGLGRGLGGLQGGGLEDADALDLPAGQGAGQPLGQRLQLRQLRHGPAPEAPLYSAG